MATQEQEKNIADGVDAEIRTFNQRVPQGPMGLAVIAFCIVYTVFHVGVMNLYPLETWTYRLLHVGGGLALGYILFAAYALDDSAPSQGSRSPLEWAVLALAAAGVLGALGIVGYAWAGWLIGGTVAPQAMFAQFGPLLAAGTGVALLASWGFKDRSLGRINPADVLLALSSIAVMLYLIWFRPQLQMRAGMPMATEADMWAAIIGIGLILELTRRLAGLALVIIAGLFILYAFVGPWLPGVFQHRGYTVKRFFTYLYTDNGILGAPVAISSTYIILFVTFAAFLQASRVGEYFVNFAFAAAGGARGGPAKVAVFGSGLMGMINGTSAGNVVSTGSLTIPLMKKVGYKPQTAASVEAAASSGGQILPPIMGAGAFIMAEITGIAYTEIVIAAIIPAVLYFASVYFNVDLAAQKYNMKGLPKEELPQFSNLARQVYLFVPILMLIGALFAGYTVIRAGTVAMIAAFVVAYLRLLHEGGGSRLGNNLAAAILMILALLPILVLVWILFGNSLGSQTSLREWLVLVISLATAAASIWVMREQTGQNTPFGQATREVRAHFNMIPFALEIAAKMSLQLVAVCAAAGVIVGVIALTGIGTRFSALLLGLAEQNQILALFFAMVVSIVLGMGMPTTAAYAVAASVMAPGLVQMGIPVLTAHFFIFYYAVMSAITPPVALAAYAGAAIAQSDPMKTSVESFRIGLAAFVVPFMFFASPAMLMQGSWFDIAHVFVSAAFGIYLLSAAVQGWFFGHLNIALRAVLALAAVAMIAGGWLTDAIGLAVGAGVWMLQKRVVTAKDMARGLD